MARRGEPDQRGHETHPLAYLHGPSDPRRSQHQPGAGQRRVGSQSARSVGDSENGRVVVASQAGSHARLHARDEPLASALRGGGGGADERRRGQQSHSVKEGGGRAAGPRRRRRWRFPIHALTATFAISSASTLAQVAAPRRSERASSRRG